MRIREEDFSGIIGPGRTSEGNGRHTSKCRNFNNTDDVRTKMIGNIKYLGKVPTGYVEGEVNYLT